MCVYVRWRLGKACCVTSEIRMPVARQMVDTDFQADIHRIASIDITLIKETGCPVNLRRPKPRALCSESAQVMKVPWKVLAVRLSQQ